MADREASQVLHAPPRQAAKPADPCAMVLFGATGDLTKRLVMPSLYNLARTGLLPDRFALIGVARSAEDVEEWRGQLRAAVESFVANHAAQFGNDHLNESVWDRLSARLYYEQGDLADAGLYRRVGATLEAALKEQDIPGNALFYLAVGDRLFGPVVDQLGDAGLTKQEHGWRRVVIEKPFGHSLETARALDAQIGRTLKEEQIFRIDHFLGKDTVQSIMAFRFANGLFEPIWNRDRIDHVQITASETVGVEARGEFYEVTGALRDMVPNHMLSLLSMVAMEPPVGFEPDHIRSKKVELFSAVPRMKAEDAVRGQYAAGTVNGEAKKPYREEPDVAKESNTETYAALKLEIDNWRWAGVPFYIRTGKHMAQRVTEIAICFKPAPYAAFETTPVEAMRPNWLVLRIAPDEGISLQCEVKRPGPVVDLAAVKMDFHYGDWFAKEPNVGYETLLYDVMIGDQTLFMRADMVEQTWRIVQPVLDAWAADTSQPQLYDSGGEGPSCADKLISRDGDRAWRSIAAPVRQS